MDESKLPPKDIVRDTDIDSDTDNSQPLNGGSKNLPKQVNVTGAHMIQQSTDKTNKILVPVQVHSENTKETEKKDKQTDNEYETSDYDHSEKKQKEESQPIDSDKEKDGHKDKKDKIEKVKVKKISKKKKKNRFEDATSSSSDSNDEDRDMVDEVPKQQDKPKSKKIERNELLDRLLERERLAGTDLSMQRILELIPSNLVTGPCEHKRLVKEIKLLGKVPTSFGESSNLKIFLLNFRYIERFKTPWTYATYNALLIHYFSTEARLSLDKLDINPNEMTSKEFVTCIMTTIAQETLSAAEYEDKFNKYRFTIDDEIKPAQCIVKLHSWLDKTAMETKHKLEKIRMKFANYFVPANLKSNFLHATSAAANVNVFINWFREFRPYLQNEFEFKRKKDRYKENKVSAQPIKVVNKQEMTEGKTPIASGTNPGAQRQRTPCEYCGKTNHNSRYCANHTDPEIRKKNIKWLEDNKGIRDLRKQAMCLKCNESTHSSASCLVYPNVAPSQEQCSRCLQYGLPRKYHPIKNCLLPQPKDIKN